MGDEKNLLEQVQAYLNLFGITEPYMIPCSYSDLLAKDTREI